MRNLKVSSKLIAGFALVVALMLGLAGVAVYQLYNVENDYAVAIEGPLTVKDSVREFQTNYNAIRISMLFIVANTGANPEQCEEQYITGTAAYESALASLQNASNAISSNPDMTEEEKKPRLAKIAQIRDLVIQYNDELIGPMQAVMRENDPAQALELMTSASYIPDQIDENSAQILATSDTTSDDYIKRANDAIRKAVIQMIAIALGAAVISVFLARYISGLISKPLSVLSDFMIRAGSTGDLTLSSADVKTIEKFSDVKDEIGRIISSFVSFLEHISYIGQFLETVANGDISQKVKLLSASDVMGVSLKKMIDGLNGMFTQIQGSTDQVASGSNQIADGAQSLASGSTEQAATLEELSASIQDISDKTKENADRTNNAARLAETIMHNAEKGSHQMERMISAVNEINHANQNISKVIKAIDDIAFQTNILALNAAVEAARAGNAGKGFAVVADEVRNLAAKSANSAKETGTLIADSMEKAKLGAQIASETAHSLEEIVKGIGESDRIIAEIARSSDEQTEAVEQVNIAINGVTQVVQQNSATAEESAAASEEMSGQAQILKSLISEFKLA